MAQFRSKKILSDALWLEKAMQAAVQDALWRHRHMGNLVAVWRDGKVVWLQPSNIPVANGPHTHKG
jgi:hypothetical protein